VQSWEDNIETGESKADLVNATGRNVTRGFSVQGDTFLKFINAGSF
jgi:hypothetical protein